MNMSQYKLDVTFVSLGKEANSDLYRAFRQLIARFSEITSIDDLKRASVVPCESLDYWQSSPVHRDQLILVSTPVDQQFGFLFKNSGFLFSTVPLMRLEVYFLSPARGPGGLSLALSGPDKTCKASTELAMRLKDDWVLALVEAASDVCEALNWRLSYNSASDA
jgi:hypothetical protein